MAAKNNNVNITVTTKDDGASKPFKDLADAAREASKAVKGVGDAAKKSRTDATPSAADLREMERQKNEKEGGGGGIGGALQKVVSVGGFGPLAGLGVAGLGAFVGKDLGGAAMGFGFNKKYGDGAAFTKDDAGILLRQAFSIKDTFTGREFRERRSERQINESLETVNRESAADSQINSLRDSLRAMTQMTVSSVGTPYAQLQRSLSNNMGQMFDVKNRAHAAGVQGDGAMEERNWQTTMVNSTTGQKRLEALKEAITAQARMTSLGRQEIEDTNKVVGLLQQKRDILQQNLQATAAGIKNQAAELGGMDKIARMQATELGGKLRRGEELTPQELEAAKGFNILGGLVQERNIKEADKSGDLAKFLEAAGNEMEKKIAVEALAKGIQIEAQIQIDEDEIAKALQRELAPLKMRLEKIIVRVADGDANMRKLDDVKNNLRAALVE